MAIPIEFTSQRLILCEGASDAQFLRALVRRTPGFPDFNVIPVGDVGNRVAGIGGFESALNGIQILRRFDQLRTIILVADCDDDDAANFSLICDQINRTAPFGTPPRTRYVAPAAPLVPSTGAPVLAVAFIPWVGDRGHLEKLLLPAAAIASPAEAVEVEAMAANIGVNTWPSVKHIAEAKLRSLLAVSNRADPRLPLSKIWTDAPHLIPITDPTFDQLATFLEGFR